MGFPAELWTYRQQQAEQATRAIERDTPLYRDCDIARLFGKFPSEFYALSEEEQVLLRTYFDLFHAKQGYQYYTKEDKHYWPQPPPEKRQRS